MNTREARTKTSQVNDKTGHGGTQGGIELCANGVEGSFMTSKTGNEKQMCKIEVVSNLQRI